MDDDDEAPATFAIAESSLMPAKDVITIQYHREQSWLMVGRK
jgi:hypothetical protein